MKHLLVLLLFMFSFGNNLYCANTNISDDTLRLTKEERYSLFSVTKYFENNRYQFTFNEISKGSGDTLFQKIKNGYYIPKETKINIWCKAIVKNESDEDLEFLFAASTYTDTVLLYQQLPNHQWQETISGLRVEPANRSISQTILKIPKGAARTFYVHQIQDNSIETGFLLYSFLTPLYEDMKNRSQRNLFLGIFYGTMLAVIIYCFVFAYFLNIKNYYLLVLLTLFYGLFFLAVNGLGDRYLWRHYPFSLLSYYGETLFSILTIGSLTAFATSFMETKKLIPKIHKLLWTVVLLTMIILVLDYIPLLTQNFPELLEEIMLFDFTYSAWLFLLLFTTIYLAVRKNKSAVLFVACSLPAVIPILNESLGIFRYGGNLMLDFYATQIGFGITAILFSFILGYNARQEQKKHRETELLKVEAIKKNEKLVLEQNVILEQKVEERTFELVNEKSKSDNLLLSILPSEIAEELKLTGTTKAKDFNEVTVLFTDFKNFSAISEQLSAQDLVNEINYCYSAFDNIITKYGIEKIKTIGDSYMCAGGLPVVNKTNAEDIVYAALEIRDFMLNEKQKRDKDGKPFFEIRIGCNTGPVVAGIVGVKKFAYDIWGDTVNIASRMESSGEPGKVNISGSTFELVKDKFKCEHRGKVEAKNKGMIDMYFVNDRLDL